MKKILLITAALFALSFPSMADKPKSISDSDNGMAQLAKYLDVYNSLFKELSMYYVDTIDAKKIIGTSIEEALSTLDPYTVYIPDEESSDFKFMMTGQYGGIGSTISQHPVTYSDSTNKEYKIIISEPYEGLPADKAELKAGDIIVEVDGNKTKGKTVSDVSEMLRGIPGTEVSIKVKRGNQILKKKIMREKISIPAVTYYGVRNDSIGYILLNQFTESAAEEVRHAINDMCRKSKIKAMVLDLRNNPGGLLDQAVQIVNMFVAKDKEVLSMKGKAKQMDQTYKTTEAAMLPDMPLAVLINGSSASASEIVSGSLQDMDRAVILGTKSFGKGLVQSTRQLPYKGALKLTTAKYYIPSGRCIQAIDYANRDENGGLKKTPDSLRHEFKTQNGRIVKDGGGIEPDFKIEKKQDYNIVYQLYVRNLIFDYATKYCMENKRISEPERFTITDEDFEDFKKFVKSSDFKYKLKTSEGLDGLKEVAKIEGYDKRAEKEFKALEEKLQPDIDTDMDMFKKDIKNIINREIVTRYYYQKGLVIYTLMDDDVLKKAIEVLNDEKLYKETLKLY